MASPLPPQQWFTATRASLINVAFGGDAYWFLPTLVVLFTVARAFRKFAPALVFAAFVIWITVPLSQPLLAEVLPTGLATNLGRWGTFGIWFLLGCFGRPFVSRIAALPLLPLLPLAAGCYAVMVWFYYVADNRGLPWIIGLNVSGLLTAVQLAVLVSRSSRLAAVGSHIARRTLPIYLLHPLIVYSVVALSRVPGVSLRLPQDSPVVNFFFVPALTAALVWVSMLIYDAAMKGPLRVVFTPASSGGGSLESRHSDHDQSART
ncbi:acyltransferase [Mycetocola manganoxydans]|uniref:acyltransferase n=1 Tax=Mycetocola manganoxydans TaxID=699879 RepID=UPI0019AB2087|nr:acyltransferase [Mycetocola manganoxydans]GHD42602.1 hypothetical protein GCM10008097_08730 [Mycetocola manganoxydans]